MFKFGSIILFSLMLLFTLTVCYSCFVNFNKIGVNLVNLSMLVVNVIIAIFIVKWIIVTIFIL